MSETVQRVYRANFILDTRGYDEPVENLVETLKGVIQEIGGEIREDRNLGQIDFAHVTERGHTGDTYIQIDFGAPGTAPLDLQDKVRLDGRVKRVMVESL